MRPKYLVYVQLCAACRPILIWFMNLREFIDFVTLYGLRDLRSYEKYNLAPSKNTRKMKKIIFPISIIMVLLFASFTTDQEKKVVRLKNGNYEVTNLKMEKSDIRAIAQALGLKLEPKDEKALGTKGYMWYMVLVASNEIDVFSDSIGSDVLTEILYHAEEDDGGDEKDAGDKDGNDEEDPQEEVDKIMRRYL